MRCMRSSRKGHGFMAPFSALSSGITDTTSTSRPPGPAKLMASRPLSSSACASPALKRSVVTCKARRHRLAAHSTYSLYHQLSISLRTRGTVFGVKLPTSAFVIYRIGIPLLDIGRFADKSGLLG